MAETTGGEAFVAETGDELADAYSSIQSSLGDTLGEEIEIVKELTWAWALAAFLLLSIAWSLSLWWLRGMVYVWSTPVPGRPRAPTSEQVAELLRSS